MKSANGKESLSKGKAMLSQMWSCAGRGFVIAVCALAPVVEADTVVLNGGKTVKGTIESVDGERIKLSGGKTVPVAGVKRVEFDAGAVVAKPDGLVLRDGSVLSGVLHGLDKRSVKFRSTALGPMDLPLSEVGGLYFGEIPKAAAMKAPPKGKVRVRLKTGSTRTGVLFAASTESLIQRTDEGLAKTPFGDIRYIAFGAATPASGVVLRNGDRIGRPARWKGGHIEVRVMKEKTEKISLKAVQSAEF